MSDLTWLIQVPQTIYALRELVKGAKCRGDALGHLDALEQAMVQLCDVHAEAGELKDLHTRLQAADLLVGSVKMVASKPSGCSEAAALWGPVRTALARVYAFAGNIRHIGQAARRNDQTGKVESGEPWAFVTQQLEDSVSRRLTALANVMATESEEEKREEVVEALTALEAHVKSQLAIADERLDSELDAVRITLRTLRGELKA